MAPDSPVVWEDSTSAITICERAKAGFATLVPELNLANVSGARLLDLFLLFTPMDEIEEIVSLGEAAGAAKFGARWRTLTKGMLLRWVVD